MAKEPTPPPISTAKPTPPPAPPPKKMSERWFVNAADETLISAVSEDGVHFNVARVMLIDGMEARALLIAAAPGMLAALKDVLAHDEGQKAGIIFTPADPLPDALRSRLLDLVNKAEGRE